MSKAAMRGPQALGEAGPADLAKAVKDAARELGADLVGLADPALLAGEPEQKRPQAIFPEVQTVVVLGRRITRGTLRGIEEGTNWKAYECFGRRYLEDQFLARTVFEVVAYLEDIGYEAVPLFGYPKDLKEMGAQVRPGQPAPNVIPDVRVAAAAAGLGEVGLLGDFITPDFGPLQKLSLILTDAPMAFDKPRRFGFCQGCQACVAACPLAAADAGRQNVVQRGGQTWNELALDEARCALCANGAAKSRFPGSKEVERIPAACGRACLASLEARGLLTRKFHHAFRVRQPWSVDAFGAVNSGGRM
ncbi:MAG TPA: hypothetical protein P5137_05510 [Candidatus Brocadiia bacterium]|nr:hypothetical protein [Candidatus Brocadiia bacterium]